jgi:cytochrome c-type biogenesis protein CcmH/NrfG
MDALEASLTKASHVSDTDDNQRLLSQFYIFKTTTLINNTATPTQELQQNITTNINNAITASKAAISLDNRDYRNYVSLGGVYEFLMSVDKSNIDAYYQNAKQAFNQAVTVYPKNPSIYLELAKLEFNYNSTSTAVVDNVNKSLQIKPNYSDAFYIFSQLAAQNNDSDNAIKFASQAVQSNPQNVDAYLQYGILNISKKDLTNQDLNNAYAAFVSVLNLDPNNLTAGYYLGVTYALAGEFDKAQNIVDILNKVIPNDEKVKGLANYIAENKGKTNTTETTNSTSTNSTSTKVINHL